MKIHNKIYSFMAVAMLLIASCSDNTSALDGVEPIFASVELSTSSAVIAREGGMKKIFVATNREAWDVVCEAEWLDISIEESSLTFFVDQNPGSESRLAIVEVVAGSGNDTAKARFKLMQEGEKAVDLSAKERANCYIARTSTTYRFDASVKGNGNGGDGNTEYLRTFGVAINDAAYADLVWEATFDGDKTRSCDIISGSPIYSPEQKAIYFTTGAIEGNALISVCDKGGKILWSWHIWVTDEEISTSTANGLVWQDRNLGAGCNTPGEISNRGLLYQWGRKEPFLPSPAPYIEIPKHRYNDNYEIDESEEEYNRVQEAIVAAREQVNINNTQTGEGSAEWHYAGFATPVALNAPGNIDYALRHPTTFLGCRTDIPIGEYVFDWYLQQDLMNANGEMMQASSYLWGSSDQNKTYKTLFDPCPAGYTVPPQGAFGEVPDGYACTDVNKEWTMQDYGWTWSGGNGDYFPSTGNFDVSGLIGETSERLLYWTAKSYGSGTNGFGKAGTLFVAFDEVYYGVYPILDGAEAAAWYSYGARCYGASVRCVKISNRQ
ncbi:MAG: BACON domain-containing protein [Alistipes sp.]|nr:BACON domain-containing protein [Alistipes sp.]